MNRAVVFALIFVVWQVNRLEAAATDCLRTNPCTRPRCEFMYELKVAKARLRALNAGFLENPDAAADADFLRYLKDSYLPAVNKTYRKYAKCPPQYFYNKVSLSVSALPPGGGRCVITAAGNPSKNVSLEDALTMSSSCAEIVKADYAGAEEDQRACLSSDKGTQTGGVQEFRKAESQLQKTKIASMEAALLQYLSSCAPDAALSRELTKAGLSALLKQGQKIRQEARRKAKRARATGRGR